MIKTNETRPQRQDKVCKGDDVYRMDVNEEIRGGVSAME